MKKLLCQPPPSIAYLEKPADGFFQRTENRKPKTENSYPKLALPSAPGFSLLEVLVATALMGLVLVVLLEVLSASLRAQEASQSQAQALLVADQVLWEFGDLRVLKPGTYQGQEGRFAYQVRLEPQFQVDNPASRVTCYLLQVTVSWEERGRTKSVGLQTVRVEAQKRS